MARAAEDRPGAGWPLVAALACGQLVSYGSIYYSFALLVIPMERELGWSRTEINGALSLGLLTAGICAYPVGHWIDRRGGRGVMAAGSALAAGLLFAWSRVEGLAAFYAIWIGLGAAMAATLYQPVFAVLIRLFQTSYRRRITVLTLVGGFASTVFIPLTQVLIDSLGWRPALLVLAALNLLLCLPIHAILLRDGDRASAPIAPPDGARAGLPKAIREPVFWLLTACFVANSATVSAIIFHLIPLLTERGLPAALIVAAIAVIGPAQVGGRILLLALGARLSTAAVGRAALLAYPVALLVLLALPGSPAALFAFVAIYGLANGVTTIVRGTAVPDLMWREGYGSINGALAFPIAVAGAASPLLAALIWTAAGGYAAVLWVLTGSALGSALCFWFAAATAERRRLRPGAAGRGSSRQ